MYRSVIESEQEGSERRRLWRWVEGILVAVVVVVGMMTHFSSSLTRFLNRRSRGSISRALYQAMRQALGERG